MTPTQLLTAQFNAEHRIAKLSQRLDKLQKTLDNYEPDPSLFEDRFIEFLDEPGPIKILDSEFYPSLILRELDSAEYDNQLSEFVYLLPWSAVLDIDPKASELEDEIDELDARIDALKDHLINIEDMLEDIEPEANAEATA